MKCTNCTQQQSPTPAQILNLQYQKQIPNGDLSIRFSLHLMLYQPSFLALNWNRRLLVLISIAQLNKPDLELQVDVLIFIDYNSNLYIPVMLL
jgi:hypothetical protein